MKSNYSKNNQTVDKLRINNAINAREVLIITNEGNTEGPCSLDQALQMARNLGLDLVEVSPNSNPPVCKILDFGKFKYNQSKKNRTTIKKKQMLKEIRMQPKISDHDLNFKTNHVQEFLLEGNKVKVTIRFKGRELAHTNLGEDILKKILELLTCNFTVDKPPAMEGRNMYMLLSPSSKAKKSTESKNISDSTNTTEPTNSDDIVSKDSENSKIDEKATETLS